MSHEAECEIRYENPWTWGMDEFIQIWDRANPEIDFVRLEGAIENREDDNSDEQRNKKLEFPLCYVMNSVTKIYVMIALNRSLERVQWYLQKVDEQRLLLTEEEIEKQGLSRHAVDHVINYTKYYALTKLEDTQLEVDYISEIQAIKSKMQHLDYLDGSVKGTINLLKSISFGIFTPYGSDRAVEYAESALRTIDKCGVIYYIHGISLRTIRRRGGAVGSIHEKEKIAFETSYHLSKNSLNGSHLADCYREMGLYEKAQELYVEVMAMNPKSCYIQLRLALGFMKFRKFQEAERCLQKVEQAQTQRKNFLHYKGLLLKKKQNFNDAAIFLKQSADMGNHAAACNYIECQEKVDTKFDATVYLKELLEIEQHQAYRKQILLLQIAMYNYFKKRNFEETLKYLAKAIDVDPDNKLLERYIYTFTTYKVVNIYEFLRLEFLPILEGIALCSDNESLRDKLKAISDKRQASS